MAAGIVESLEASVGLADHDHGFAHEIMADPIALLLELLHHRAKMPDPGPELIPLLLHPLFRIIALTRDRIATHRRVEFGALAAKEGVYGHCRSSTPGIGMIMPPHPKRITLPKA
jgi:hypothetical protein